MRYVISYSDALSPCVVSANMLVCGLTPWPPRAQKHSTIVALILTCSRGWQRLAFRGLSSAAALNGLDSRPLGLNAKSLRDIVLRHPLAICSLHKYACLWFATVVASSPETLDDCGPDYDVFQEMAWGCIPMPSMRSLTGWTKILPKKSIRSSLPSILNIFPDVSQVNSRA